MRFRFVWGASGAGKSYVIKDEMIRRGAASLDHFAHMGKGGRMGTGDARTAAVRENAATRADDAAGCDDTTNYLYVVPDQFTMQSQKDLVLASGDQGILNIDVLSFSRLSHRIFEELGAPDKAPLDDIGKSLVLRRVASQIRGDLKVLGDRMGRLGMISEVKSMISEFMQYGLGVDDVRGLAAYATEHGQGALAARLTDLARLYEAFLIYEQDRYMTGEETLDLLAQMIPRSTWIAESVLVFDGFTGFTPIQYRVIKALLETAREVTFVLTLGDDGGPDVAETLDKDVPIDPQDLFYLTRHTARSILRIAQEAGVPHGQDIDLTGGKHVSERVAAHAQDVSSAASVAAYDVAAAQTADDAREAGTAPRQALILPRFAGNPALAHLEHALFRYPLQQRASADGRIAIYASSSPEEEVREMCIRIHALVREQGIAYRDCSIVCGDLASYEDALRKMAVIYDLPIYIDTARAVLRNPLTESIRGALEVTAGDYSYNTMFRYLRAGLSALPAEEIDILENYCLAQGIRTKRQWTTAFTEDIREAEAALQEVPETSAGSDTDETASAAAETPGNGAAGADPDEAAANTANAGIAARSPEVLRQTVMRELEPLMGLRGKTATERTWALYRYLLGVQARERMLAYANRFGEQGDLARQQEYAQIYRAVMALLDQLYALIGDEDISATDYLEILEAGFQEIRLGVLPQDADRILAGDIERSRIPECRVLFFLGANDGNVPAGTSKGGLVSDLDREFLAGSDAELSPTPREQMYLQRLYLYLNMTKASDRLVISYAQTRTDGTSTRPSYLVSTICQMYEDLKVSLPERDGTTPAMADRLVGPADTRQFLAVSIRQFVDGMFDLDGDARNAFLTVYGYAARRDPGAQALAEAAFSHYRDRRIDRRTAEALYHRILSGSVTRLEMAARCMLQHYLHYGLRLREREERRFEQRDAGSILHAAIQCFSEMIRDRGMDWNTFTPQEGIVLADEAYEAVTTGYDHGLVQMDARTAGAAERMRRVLYRTIRVLQYQIRHGEFVPVLFEARFDESGAMRYDLGDGRGARLSGRIDRVDLCEQDGRVYVKIIDYKSGRKDINMDHVAEGLQLQLPLYMEAEMDVQQGLHPTAEIVPAGMLYYRFDDPILTDKSARAAIGSWLAAAYAEQAAGVDASHIPGSEQAAGTDAPYLLDSEEAICRALRPTGRVNSDAEALALLDDHHDKASQVIPVEYGRSGLTSRSRVLSTEEFRQMFDDVRRIICDLTSDILDGDVTAHPVDEGNQQTACQHCDYRDVCGFDRKLPGYEYRSIKRNR